MSARAVVEVVGSGPDLVLVHGWAMHRGVWATIAEDLAGHFRLHLVDLPGHGEAAGQALPGNAAELAEDLVMRLPPAAWLGWSMGGLVTLQALLVHGERISRAILVSTNPSFIVRGHWPAAMPRHMLTDFRQRLGQDPQDTVERFLKLETLGSDRPRATLRALRASLQRVALPGVGVLEKGLGILRDSDYTAALSTIAHEVLWLAGEGDRLVPPKAMERAAGLMPRGRCVRLPGACHAPFISHPRPFVAHIKEFLGGKSCRTN